MLRDQIGSARDSKVSKTQLPSGSPGVSLRIALLTALQMLKHAAGPLH
jgi:hypothetical protein